MWVPYWEEMVLSDSMAIFFFWKYLMRILEKSKLHCFFHHYDYCQVLNVHI